MGKTIAIANQKGGVGKTTTTLSMAAVMAAKGYKVLAIDLDDGNASLTKTLGIEPEDTKKTMTDIMLFEYMRRSRDGDIREAIVRTAFNFDLVPADSELAGITNILSSAASDERNKMVLARALCPIKDEYDYILLDTAPTLNILFVNALAVADEVIITTQSQKAAEDAIGELINTLINVKENVNPNIIIKGLLITMVDNRTKYEKNKQNSMSESFSDLGMRVFKTSIPRGIDAAKCVEEHQPVTIFEPKSKVAKAYVDFVDELIARSGEHDR